MAIREIYHDLETTPVPAPKAYWYEKEPDVTRLR